MRLWWTQDSMNIKRPSKGTVILDQVVMPLRTRLSDKWYSPSFVHINFEKLAGAIIVSAQAAPHQDESHLGPSDQRRLLLAGWGEKTGAQSRARRPLVAQRHTSEPDPG